MAMITLVFGIAIVTFLSGIITAGSMEELIIDKTDNKERINGG